MESPPSRENVCIFMCVLLMMMRRNLSHGTLSSFVRVSTFVFCAYAARAVIQQLCHMCSFRVLSVIPSAARPVPCCVERKNTYFLFSVWLFVLSAGRGLGMVRNCHPFTARDLMDAVLLALFGRHHDIMDVWVVRPYS